MRLTSGKMLPHLSLHIRCSERLWKGRCQAHKNLNIYNIVLIFAGVEVDIIRDAHINSLQDWLQFFGIERCEACP